MAVRGLDAGMSDRGGIGQGDQSDAEKDQKSIWHGVSWKGSRNAWPGQVESRRTTSGPRRLNSDAVDGVEPAVHQQQQHAAESFDDRPTD
ncbi:hypothetical protein WN48_06951 [Eufriesea mexicana]|uniref:Uncharacterized protein n=1 Tax=Eufriesea mexicana TaxID=516756 RepID=A0A310SW54_9HYME|nr:hypothetical protein WN48_06951 [Eufriesea mexicana]